jgi:hypothetical protein
MNYQINTEKTEDQHNKNINNCIVYNKLVL